jgi:hypothetical protein
LLAPATHPESSGSQQEVQVLVMSLLLIPSRSSQLCRNSGDVAQAVVVMVFA